MMTFEMLLNDFGSGFALDSLEQLRSAATGLTTTKAQRKRLAAEIEEASARGRAGRTANLILIGLVTNQDHWLDWLKHSSVLRPSGYDLDTATLRKLIPLVHRIAHELSLSGDFQGFLESLDWLLVLAEAAHKKRIALIKLIAKDKLLVKSCLVTTDILFMGRTFNGINPDAPMTPEDAAGALSYLIYLVQKRFGPDGILLDGVDTIKIRKGYYLAVLEETQAITEYFTWELLVCYFGYSCRLSTDHSALHFDSPSPEFAKSMRSGFIRQELQNRAFLLQLKDEALVSLNDVSQRFYTRMEAAKLIWRGTEPDRWKFGFPVIPEPMQFFAQDSLFREEYAGLTLLCYDLLSSFDEAIACDVGGVSIMDLIKAQRLMYVTHRVRYEKLKKHWTSDPDACVQSIAAVYDDDSLLNYLGYAFPRESAEKILALLEWNPKQKTYLDLMYQPLVRAAGNNLLVAPNLFAVANLPRNTLQLTQKRLGEKGDGLLAQRLTKEFQGQGFVAWDDVEYSYAGIKGDGDVVALQGEFLFIFECKNSLHPCSAAELRTSYEYLLKARRQLEKFMVLWNTPGFRKYFAKLLKTDLSAVKTVIPAAVTGNRMFGGLQLGAANVLGFHELVNFINSGRIIIFGKEIVGRPSGPLSPEQLRDFVTSTPWEKPMRAAMKRRDKVTRYGGMDIRVEDYSLKLLDLAHAWNVEVPEKLKSLLADDVETVTAAAPDDKGSSQR
jgi:hypothetical protein